MDFEAELAIMDDMEMEGVESSGNSILVFIG
jgi:hypothetical protein